MGRSAADVILLISASNAYLRRFLGGSYTVLGAKEEVLPNSIENIIIKNELASQNIS